MSKELCPAQGRDSDRRWEEGLGRWERPWMSPGVSRWDLAGTGNGAAAGAGQGLSPYAPPGILGSVLGSPGPVLEGLEPIQSWEQSWGFFAFWEF